MATDRSQPVVVTQDFGNAQRIKNLPNAVDNQEPVTLAQLVAQLLLKQDVVSGGAGIILDGNAIEVDLATAGSDYSSFTLTNTDHASLNGTYTRLNYRAYLEYAGTNLDLNYGGDFNVYYKDNGSGVWAICARREIDGSAATSDSGTWMAVLVTIDPTTVSSTVSSFVPDYQAVDSDTVANADVLDESGHRSPAEGYVLNDLVYGTGSTPAGLKFDNNKLALDFANTTGDASSTKVFPSSVVKTYIDEQVSDAKDLSNHPFSNTIAQIAGNPTNAQSAFEALAAENDTQDSQISAIQTVNTTQTSQITAVASAVGVALGSSNLGAMTTSWLTDNSDVKTLLDEIAMYAEDVHDDLYGHLGILEADVGLGAMTSTIFTDDGSVKTMMEEAGAAIESLQVGAGAFWTAVNYHHHTENTALPAGWGDGSTDVGSFVVDPNGSNLAVSAMSTGSRILVITDGGAVDAGIYVVNADDSVSRSADADADADFTTNKTVNIINGGSHAGATYAYTGSDNPVVGTDALTFEFKQGTNVGDNTITEAKLAPALADKINDKSDKYVETVTTDGSGYVTVTHDLGTADFIAQVWTTTGTVEVVAAEISDPTVNSVVIGGVPSTTYKVVLIG